MSISSPRVPQITPDNVVAAVATGATHYVAIADVFGVDLDLPTEVNPDAGELGLVLGALLASRQLEEVAHTTGTYRVNPYRTAALGLTGMS